MFSASPDLRLWQNQVLGTQSNSAVRVPVSEKSQKFVSVAKRGRQEERQVLWGLGPEEASVAGLHHD